MHRIERATIENIKRITDLTITFGESHYLYVAGPNGAGKSSALDALQLAFAGGRAKIDEPLRKGARRGQVEIELEDLVIRKTVTKGDSVLEVTTKDGRRIASPQKLLDSLFGPYAFDPMRFAESKPAEQRNALLAALGLADKVAEFDGLRRTLYERRTEINREVDRYRKLLDGYEEPPTEVPEERGAAEILARLQAAQTLRGANTERRRALRLKTTRLEDLDRQIAELQALLAEREAARDELHAEIAAEEVDVDAIVDPNTDAIAAELAGLEEHNRAARELRDLRQTWDAWERAAAEAASLTGQIEDCDRDRASWLEAAAFPVRELGVDDEGVTYAGLPLETASFAQRLTVGVAIAIATMPVDGVRLLRIEHGEALDEATAATVIELAGAHDVQLLIERVADRPGQAKGPSIFIREGKVVEEAVSADA